MDNIQKMMNAWGSWAVFHHVDIKDKISTNKIFIPEKIKRKSTCNQDDIRVINHFMTLLSSSNQEDYDLLVNYYAMGKTFIELAKLQSCSDTYIGKRLKKAEGIIEGMLILSGEKKEKMRC